MGVTAPILTFIEFVRRRRRAIAGAGGGLTFYPPPTFHQTNPIRQRASMGTNLISASQIKNRLHRMTI